jgi:hypothetical protein
LGVRQVRLVPDDNSAEAGLIDATGDNGLGVLLWNGLRINDVFGNKAFIARLPDLRDNYLLMGLRRSAKPGGELPEIQDRNDSTVRSRPSIVIGFEM